MTLFSPFFNLIMYHSTLKKIRAKLKFDLREVQRKQYTGAKRFKTLAQIQMGIVIHEVGHFWTTH